MKEGDNSMKKRRMLFLFVATLLFPSLYPAAQSQPAHKSHPSAGGAVVPGTEQYPPMPGPGKKVSIGNDYYFTYGFDKKPKLGTIIMKVELYNKEGKKETSLEVKADSGMPSMKGAHETGERPFKLSKKGDYLLPIDIVMPGDWEIRLTFLKDGKAIFRGSYQFDV
jgi:hypothetical protein